MVENVSKDALKFHTNALRHSEIFPEMVRSMAPAGRLDILDCILSRAIAVATASGETLNVAAQLQYDVLISLSELWRSPACRR